MDVLRGKRIRVLGYGIQGRAQALNLHDAGLDVAVGLREGSPSAQKANDDGLRVVSLPKAVQEADVLLILIPDEEQARAYATDIEPHLQPGTCMVFAHGFTIHFQCIEPPASVDVVLVAPKGPGQAVRDTYLAGSGVPALLAVQQDATGNAHAIASAIAQGIGAARIGCIDTTFAAEVETDLFGEQAVLCGGAVTLIECGFDVLVEAGYDPALAYFEVLHELKMIVDLIQEGGIESMWKRVSNTAEYGGRTRGSHIHGDDTKQKMREVLDDIRNGAFATEWVDEHQDGIPLLQDMRKTGADRPVEHVGHEVRSMFRPGAPS